MRELFVLIPYTIYYLSYSTVVTRDTYSLDDTDAYLIWVHWLTQHITSHGPRRFCSASCVATMCVRSKRYAFGLLRMTVCIWITCAGRSGELSTLQGNITEKEMCWCSEVVTFKASHFCHYQHHHAHLFHACLVEHDRDGACYYCSEAT